MSWVLNQHHSHADCIAAVGAVMCNVEKHTPRLISFNLMNLRWGLTSWRRQEGIGLLECLSGLRTTAFHLILWGDSSAITEAAATGRREKRMSWRKRFVLLFNCWAAQELGQKKSSLWSLFKCKTAFFLFVNDTNSITDNASCEEGIIVSKWMEKKQFKHINKYTDLWVAVRSPVKDKRANRLLLCFFIPWIERQNWEKKWPRKWQGLKWFKLCDIWCHGDSFIECQRTRLEKNNSLPRMQHRRPGQLPHPSAGGLPQCCEVNLQLIKSFIWNKGGDTRGFAHCRETVYGQWSWYYCFIHSTQVVWVLPIRSWTYWMFFILAEWMWQEDSVNICLCSQCLQIALGPKSIWITTWHVPRAITREGNRKQINFGSYGCFDCCSFTLCVNVCVSRR